eukprot:gnl/Dysnectes_brevis/4747_a6534_373.p1 GENE.gnl/Dysnectes_brevis/4747_a6534_373~~gnl/Dysnectes_brevis/4747_a6534_373.p1  ORF type:complete len:1165 (-),score=294.46 gnl/Dysnectes_brevis/4747_a6534_373:80-3574(-)
MFIEEIILDGFKSYAHKTRISCLDQTFNAITGLNGSGKSNILDAICFVLGITNLSRIRVSVLSELIYMQGQAGVTKAAVSLVLNNTDPSQSPAGYESMNRIVITREITRSGTTRYLINSRPSKVRTVRTLFHSVGLNVNNPHFLIMQGRITKILGSKPQEILSMLEEAAGTSMFDVQRKHTESTFSKKQKRLDEIERTLKEDISPRLARLERERKAAERAASLKRDRDVLLKKHAVARYAEAASATEEAEDTVASLTAEIGSLEDEREKIETERKETQATLNMMQRQRESSPLEAKLSQLDSDRSATVVSRRQALSRRKQAAQTLARSNAELTRASIRLKSAEKDAEKAGASLEKLTRKVGGVREAYAAASASAASSEAALSELRSGVASDGGTLVGRASRLGGQVAEAKAQLDGKKTTQTRHHEEIGRIESSLRSASASAAPLRASLKQAQHEKKRAEEELAALSAVESPDASITSLPDLSSARSRLKQVQAEHRNIRSRLPAAASLSQEVADQYGVHGLVGQLVHVKDPQWSRAVEVTAGGRLFNVVTTTLDGGKDFIGSPHCRRRVTIIPLDSLHAPPLSAAIKKQLHRRFKGRARLAVEYVGYESELEVAMQFCFGRRVLCEDLETARNIALSRGGLGLAAVTKEGDLVDPQGLVTGGSRGGRSSLLQLLSRFSDLSTELEETESVVREAEAALASSKALRVKIDKARESITLSTRKIEILGQRLAATASGRLEEELDRLHGAIESLAVEIRKEEEELAGLTAEYTEAQGRATAFSQGTEERNGQIRALEKQLKRAQRDLKKLSTSNDDAESRLESEVLALEAASEEVTQLKVGVEEIENEQKQLEQSLNDANSEVDRVDTEIRSLDDQIQVTRAKITGEGGRVGEVSATLTALENRVSALDVRAGKVFDSLDASRETLRKSIQLRDKLRRANRWVVDAAIEEPPEQSTDTLKARLDALNEELSGLRVSSTASSLVQYEELRRSADSLTSMRQQLSEDRSKIETMIQRVTAKKMDALTRVHRQVSQDLGVMFGTVLPGSDASLEAVGSDISSGLQFKVSLGGSATSLSGLSGGQRSLLALSLVLALLRFKPAPIYILDEVDAALDLSHTQNIGRLIKEQFGDSQFIIVSLKEGMFNNANVLFRTKFIGGVSTVERHAGGM